MPEASIGVNLAYLPGTPRYRPDQEALVTTYLPAIAAPPDELRALLVEPNPATGKDFHHVDGAVTVTESSADVTNVSVETGRDRFVDGFRQMVNRQSELIGPITGYWLSPEALAPLEARVNERLARLLPAGFNLGKLVAAAVVEFPYMLRDDPGADPFEIPPPLRGLIRPQETFMHKALRFLKGQKDQRVNMHTVRALQALYADEEGKISARVGLVWDDDRGVPFAIHKEMSAARGENPKYKQPQTAQAIAELLTRQAQAAA